MPVAPSLPGPLPTSGSQEMSPDVTKCPPEGKIATPPKLENSTLTPLYTDYIISCH